MRRSFATLGLLGALLLSGRTARAEGSSLGAGVGSVKPKDVESTLWFTGTFRFHVGKNFAIEPEVGYWKKSQSFFGIESSLEDLNFGVSALLVFPSGRVEAFLGGGVGAHQIKGRVGVVGLGSASDSATKAGLHVLAGIDVKASEGLSFFGAARFDTVPLDGDSGERLDQTKFYGGLRLRF